VPSSDPVQRFQDILENIGRIEKHTAGMDSSTAFMEDHKTYDAVERCLERISEASKKLGSVAEDLCPGIPWANLRPGKFLRHEYDRIQGDRLWIMVERDLVPLKLAVAAALQALRREEDQS
jgi:uncharacterized protein with HEPN domain